MSTLKDRLLERINSLNFSDSEEESNYKKSLKKNNQRDKTFPNKKLKFDDNPRKNNADLPRSIVERNEVQSRNYKQNQSHKQKKEINEKHNEIEQNNQTFADIERRIQQLELDLSRSLMSSQNNHNNNSQHKIGDESSINYSDSMRDQKGEYEYYDVEMQQHNKELEQITQTMGNVLDNKNFSQISYLPHQSNQQISKRNNPSTHNCTSCTNVGSFNCVQNQHFQECLCCKQTQHQHFHSCHSNHTFNTENDMQCCSHQNHNNNTYQRQNVNSQERNYKNGNYVYQDHQQTYQNNGKLQRNMSKNFENFEKETQELNRRVAEIKKELEDDNESSENSDYESSNKQKDRSLLDSNSFYKKQKSNDVSVDSATQRKPQKSILKHNYYSIDQKIQNSQMKLLQELEKSYTTNPQIGDGNNPQENNHYISQKYHIQQQDRSSYYTNNNSSLNEQKYQFSQNNQSSSNQLQNDKENNYHFQNYSHITTTPFLSRPLFNDADKTELLNQLAREKQLLEEIANLRRQNNQLASQNGSRNGSRNASRKESRHEDATHNKSRNNSSSRSASREYKTPDLKYAQEGSEENIKRKKRQNSISNNDQKNQYQLNGENKLNQYESHRNPNKLSNKSYESQRQKGKQLDIIYSTRRSENYQTQQQQQNQNDNNFYSKRSDSQTNTRRAPKQQKQVQEIEKLKKETELLKQVERIRKNIQHSIKKKINEQKLIEKQEKAQKARRQQHNNPQYDSQNQQKHVSKSQMQNHCQNCSFLLNRGIPTTYCSCDKNRK